MRSLSALNIYFKQYKWWFIFGVAFTIISNYFAVAAPQLTGFLVEHIVKHLSIKDPNPVHKSKYGWLIRTVSEWIESHPSFSMQIIYGSVALLLFALVRGFFLFCMRQSIIVASRHIEYDLKNAIYNQYQKLNLEFYKTNSTGDLMNRISEDVSKVRMYVGPAIMYIANFTTLIFFSLFFMFQTNVALSFYSLIPLPLLAIIIYFVNTYIHKKSEIIQAQLSVLTSKAQESFSGIRIIKSFSREKLFLQKFSDESNDYLNKSMGLAKLEATFFPSMNLLIGMSSLISVYVGGLFVMDNSLSVSTIIEFLFYINMLTFPVGAIGFVAGMVQRAAASQKRINEFLHLEPSFEEYHTASKATTEPLNIFPLEFINISFLYPHSQQKALQNFSLRIEQGQKIAIMGKAGAGKTSLALLLLKLYPPHAGSLLLGNKKIEDIDTLSLRKTMNYVPQDPYLFSDTIANNIQFGLDRKASQKEIEQAAKIACIHDEILELEKGYDTIVGERGVMLSGGQKQRISIARALIKPASLLLFDDCLSAVDTKTEHKILRQFKAYSKNITNIFITHRIFTSMTFDNIIILDHGKIVEQGTHEELLKKQGYYNDIYSHQNDLER